MTWFRFSDKGDSTDIGTFVQAPIRQMAWRLFAKRLDMTEAEVKRYYHCEKYADIHVWRGGRRKVEKM